MAVMPLEDYWPAEILAATFPLEYGHLLTGGARLRNVRRIEHHGGCTVYHLRLPSRLPMPEVPHPPKR